MQSKFKFLLVPVLIISTIIGMASCGEDEAVNPEETETFVSATDFLVSMGENPSVGDVIGTVSVDTADEALISYAITSQNISGAIAIDASTGELTVADAKAFDFETNTSIVATYQASVGDVSDSADIIITVNDESDTFISVWEVTEMNKTVDLPLYEAGGEYNFTVDWGDGTTGTVTSFDDEDRDHTYEGVGLKTVTITGTLVGFNFIRGGVNSILMLKDITQWGPVHLGFEDGVFFGCRQLEDISAKDSPDLTGITSMENYFYDCSNFNGDISDWDVSNVTNMRGMFNYASDFNQDISGWDVSNVTDMYIMFASASDFNQDISGWDVSNVTNMVAMFFSAPSFNQSLSGWDVANVTDMSLMFFGASVFNQGLSDWDVSKVTNMDLMFAETSSFDGDISGWDVSSITSMNGMFLKAPSFNQDISGWDVSNVTSMLSMFYEASSFNHNLSGWNTKNVGDCNNFAVGSAIGEDGLPTKGCFE